VYFDLDGLWPASSHGRPLSLNAVYQTGSGTTSQCSSCGEAQTTAHDAGRWQSARVRMKPVHPWSGASHCSRVNS